MNATSRPAGKHHSSLRVVNVLLDPVLERLNHFYHGYLHCVFAHLRLVNIEASELRANHNTERTAVEEDQTIPAVEAVLTLRQWFTSEVGAD